MYFWLGIWKYYFHVSNQHPQICLVAKFGAKIKILKFGTKNVLFGYFWAWNLKKTIVRFEISTFKYVYLQNITKKQKCLNFGPKMPDLCIFGLKFENNIVIFEINPKLTFSKNKEHQPKLSSLFLTNTQNES